MDNFIQQGDVLEVTAPGGGVSSGDLIIIGAIAGVATKDAVAAAKVNIQVTGVFDLPKTSAQAWSEGDRIYWDAGNSRADKTATLGKLIGIAAAAAADPSATGKVRLNAAAPEFAEGQQAAVADVATADADATYGQPEADLINELKAQLNAALAALRAAGIIAT
jgi:predicted RecA/RadA family phage recombinase